jgi:hypothetical protein
MTKLVYSAGGIFTKSTSTTPLPNWLARLASAHLHRFLIPGDPAPTIECVIPEAAGLCQLVVGQWFCWLLASVYAVTSKGRVKTERPQRSEDVRF